MLFLIGLCVELCSPTLEYLSSINYIQSVISSLFNCIQSVITLLTVFSQLSLY